MAQLHSPTAQEFHPLKYFIDHPKQLPWVAYELKSDLGFLRATTKALADLGFRKFSFLGAGGVSLVFETTDNQLVRLSCQDNVGDYGKHPYHPAILQPICRKKISHGFMPDKRKTMIIEILPKVRTEGVEQYHAAMVEEALLKSGYIVEDMYEKDAIGRRTRDDKGNFIYRTSNIGLIDIDGKTIPVLIDAGLIKKTRRTAKDNDHLEDWLDTDGTWLQNKFEPRTAPSDVINKDSFRKIDQTLRGPKSLWSKLGLKKDDRRISQTAEAIEKDGMYPHDIEYLYARAIKQLDNPNINFSDLLKEEREKMQNSHEKPPSK